MICTICKIYFKLNLGWETKHNNLSQKQLSHQDTPVGIQCSYLKSVQTPQPTCRMALAAGWEPAVARILFNRTGNGCFPNQSFGSRETPILWTGFMVSFVWEEIKVNGQNLILYLKIMAQEPIFQLELRVFVKQVGLRGNLLETWGFSWACKNILISVDLWDFRYKIQWKDCS